MMQKKTTSFLSFIFYSFKNLIAENGKYYNNELYSYYWVKVKGYEAPKKTTIIKKEIDKNIYNEIIYNEPGLFESALERLKEPYKTIFKLYFDDEYSLKKIATYLFESGLTKKKYSHERIRQMKNESLNNLKKMLNKC